MVEALGRLDEIDPAACREYVQEKFSVSKCTDGYEQVYREVLDELSVLVRNEALAL